MSSTGIGLDPVEVDADPDDLRLVEIWFAPSLRERALDAVLKAEQVIARMLTSQEAVFRIKQDALRAGRIVDDPTAELGAVRTADDKRAHRVGSEIDA